MGNVRKSQAVGGNGVYQLVQLFIHSNRVSVQYQRHIRCCARQMHEFGITTKNIDNQRVARWLASMRGEYSDQTIVAKRAIALRLWRFGIEAGVVTASNAIQVLTIQPRRKPIRAYRLRDLTEAYKKMQQKNIGKSFGCFRRTKCPRQLWILAWFRIAFETGYRFSDIYELRDTDIVDAGINVVTNKTGRELTRKISDETRDLIDSMLAWSTDGSIFSCHIGKCGANLTVSQLFKKVGLTQGHTQWLRRSAATQIEREHPGLAGRFLGHLTPGLAARHYIDHSQLDADVPMPPSLTERMQ